MMIDPKRDFRIKEFEMALELSRGKLMRLLANLRKRGWVSRTRKNRWMVSSKLIKKCRYVADRSGVKCHRLKRIKSST
jgi:predicted transcriptional regulator